MRRQSAWDAEPQHQRQHKTKASSYSRQASKSLAADSVARATDANAPQVAENSSHTKHLVGSDVEHLHKQSAEATGEIMSHARNLPPEITDSHLSDARSDVQRARQELHEQQDALSSMSHFEKQARLKQLQSLGKENQQAVGLNDGVTAMVADKSKPQTGKANSHRTSLYNALDDGADGSDNRNENRASESEHEPSNVADCDTEQWLKRIVAQYGHGS